MSTTAALPTRADVDPKYTWNLSSVFPDETAWETALAELQSALPKIEAFQGSLTDSATQLADLFELMANVRKAAGHVRIWAGLQYSAEITNQAAAARMGRAQSVLAKLAATTAFIEPELMGLSDETIEQWLSDEPRLAIYRHYFERLSNRKAHLRSAEVEQLLAEAMDAFTTASASHGILMNADLRFDRVDTDAGDSIPVSQATFRNTMTNPDRSVRQAVWESYQDGHLSVKNTFANNYHAYLKQNVFFARARSYNSVIEESLAANQIPLAVYHNVIDVFRERRDVWQRYFAVRKQALGIDTLGPFDMWAPLSEQAPTISFEQSVDMIADGMQPLGEAYVEVFKRGCLEQRWVDVYPNQGKRQGAFSAGSPGTHPFIMMSSGDDIMGMSTLAHELGHSMHSYLTWQHQPMAYSRYSLFVAEVASNFNQALVRHHLLQTNDDRNFRIALLEEAISNFYRYFFIMPTLARFELAAHTMVEEGKPLTADVLNGISAEFFQEGYGDQVSADQDRIGITWATFPHMYNRYYVYQYATGIAGAHALAAPIIAGENGAVDRYLDFLRAGSSDYPLPVLQRAGVDLSTPEPIHLAFDTLSDYVDQLAALIG